MATNTGGAQPGAARNVKYEEWVNRVRRQPASGPLLVRNKEEMFQLALHIQHPLCFVPLRELEHLLVERPVTTNLTQCCPLTPAYGPEAPTIRRLFQSLTRWCFSCMALTLHAKIRRKQSRESDTVSDFLMTVNKNLLCTVAPDPRSEFQLIV